MTDAHESKTAAVRTLVLYDRELEYEDVPGDDELAPLVLLHDGVGSLGLWRGLHRRLAETTGRRSVAYSRFGHGFSDPPAGAHTPRFMHDEANVVLPALLDRLGIVEPLLVGHSDGASITLLHAAAHPVAGAAVLAPHVLVEQRSLDGIRRAREQFTGGALRQRMSRHHRDVELTFHLWNDIWLAPEFRDWNIERELADITASVLVMQGEDDQYGTLAHADSIRRTVRGPARVLLVPGDHWPHREHPERIVAAITEFADTLRLGGAGR